ncbi:MAG: 30S ribosomal protein S17e [Candidatus Aenigmatarchaeota archaeon]
MGRVKIIPIKSLGNSIMETNPGKFSEDFDKNKKAVNEAKDIKSKKVRNIVAGYITGKMKQKRQAEKRRLEPPKAAPPMKRMDRMDRMGRKR